MSKSVRESTRKSDAVKEDKTTQTKTSNYLHSVNSYIDQILFFQRSIGNQAVGKLIQSGALQAAHEFVHVRQQDSFLQRQNSNVSIGEKEINISDELLEIPANEEAPVVESSLPDEIWSPAMDKPEINEPYILIQRKPLLVQRNGSGPATVPTTIPAAIVRKDLVFIMGTKGGFYTSAKKFFSQHYPEAEIVKFEDRSLSGIFKVLRSKISDAVPAGNIYIVSHANQDGTLSFPLDKKDRDKKISFGDLKVALKDKVAIFRLNGGIDDKSFIHIKGCNIGRNIEMLNALDEAFGGKEKVDAPTHKQSYEYHSKRVGKKSVIVSSEYFNTLILEYTGSVDIEKDTLVSDFKEKYSQFGYQDHEWKMMVKGAKKYNMLIDKQGRDKKTEIDYEAKRKKKNVDKKDKDALKAIDANTRQAKADVDVWIKEMKTSKVANKSPGVDKKVVKKFTAFLYDGVDPTIDKSKILPFAQGFFRGKVPKGFVFTECTSVSAKKDDPMTFVIEFLAENKKTKESQIFTYTLPKFPKSDDDGRIIADELLEEEVGKKPESEIARKDMYTWRIERKKRKNTVKITAFLEMTQYTIDVSLKEETGDVIDPSKKKGEEFYYGSSDFE